MAQVSDDIVLVSQSANDIAASSRSEAKTYTPLSEMSGAAYARLLATDIGNIDVTDEDTLQLARATLNIIEKKINAEKSKKPNIQALLEIETDQKSSNT